MSRPEPPQTAPVTTGLAREDALAERLTGAEIPAGPRGAKALEAEGLTVEEGAGGPAIGGPAIENGLAAADAAAADLPAGPAPDEEPAPEAPADEEERYVRGHQPARGFPPEELEQVDDWDDQTAAEQQNLPEDEQQG